MITELNETEKTLWHLNIEMQMAEDNLRYFEGLANQYSAPLYQDLVQHYQQQIDAIKNKLLEVYEN